MRIQNTYCAWIEWRDGSITVIKNLSMHIAKRKYRLFEKDTDMVRCGWSSMSQSEYC